MQVGFELLLMMINQYQQTEQSERYITNVILEKKGLEHRVDSPTGE